MVASAVEPTAGQIAGATYKRLSMSTSQLLTITEMHGFRTLLAASAWLVGCLIQLWCGLQNVWCGNLRPRRPASGSSSVSPVGTGIGDVAIALSEPVDWFGTSESSIAPDYRRWRQGHVLFQVIPTYSPAPVFAKQARSAANSPSQ